MLSWPSFEILPTSFLDSWLNPHPDLFLCWLSQSGPLCTCPNHPRGRYLTTGDSSCARPPELVKFYSCRQSAGSLWTLAKPTLPNLHKLPLDLQLPLGLSAVPMEPCLAASSHLEMWVTEFWLSSIWRSVCCVLPPEESSNIIKHGGRAATLASFHGRQMQSASWDLASPPFPPLPFLSLHSFSIKQTEPCGSGIHI